MINEILTSVKIFILNDDNLLKKYEYVVIYFQ